MLVLTRKMEQSIAVGGTTGFESILKITVLGIAHGSVRLGFEVDGSVPVHRWEVWERIHAGTVSVPLVSRPAERPDVSTVL